MHLVPLAVVPAKVLGEVEDYPLVHCEHTLVLPADCPMWDEEAMGDPWLGRTTEPSVAAALSTANSLPADAATIEGDVPLPEGLPILGATEHLNVLMLVTMND